MQTKIDKNNVKDVYSLSSTQQGILFHYLSNSDSPQYVEQLSLTLAGNICPNRIQETWQKLAADNEMLRTIFRWKGLEKPIQILLKYHEIPFKVLDISKDDPMDMEEIFKGIKDTDRRKKVDISEEPFRITLIKLHETQWEMLITNHHILYDGWSTGILLKEFFETYENDWEAVETVQKEKNKYKEYIKWCNSQDPFRQKEYWQQYLEDFNTVTPLTARNNSKEASKETSIKKVSKLPEDLVDKMTVFCRENHITIATLLYTGWGILLGKYSNSQDVVFGTTVSGRPAEIRGIEEMVGLFINTLPLRLRTKASDTVKELLQKVNETLKERTPYENTPLVDIQQSSQLSNTQLFDNIVVIENYPMDQLLKDMKGSIEVRGFSMEEETNYPLTLGISVFDGVEFTVIYQGDLEGDGLGQLLNHYENIISAILKNPLQKISEVDILTEEEKKLILETFNDTKRDYPRDKTIHQLFEEQVERTPNKKAVVFQDKTLTYQELNEVSNQLAKKLKKKGVKADNLIGVMVGPSLELIIAIMAILKAGGGYLPIDPDQPIERIKYMIEDSGSQLLLTQQHLSNKGGLVATDVILIDSKIDNSDLFKKNICNINNANSPTDLAYVMYTSGSTGKSKGVMIEHRSVLRLVKNTNYIEFREDDKILMTGAIGFDATTFEIWGALLNGLELHMVDIHTILDAEKLKKTIKEKNITLLWLTVSLFNQLVQQSVDIFAPLRYLLVGGDALTPKYINLVRNAYPHINIINGYGPTENTTFSNCFRIDREYTDSIPIGGPIANSTAYILDQYNNPQPIGIAGELCLGGDGLGRGYLNRPELSKEKFADNPFIEGEKMYRTGDLARWLSDGNIEFLGRRDHQVKIRGFRIELGEIEYSLLKLEEVKEAIVLAKEDKRGSKYLTAYIVTNPEIPVGEIKVKLAEELPDYMIPPYITQLKEMPLTPNGKIDRRALPEPDTFNLTGAEDEAPRDHTEETLVGIWKDILGVETIGINHNFFELGGHSLKTTALVAKIHKTFNIEIPIKLVFQKPTIKELAEIIKTSKGEIQGETKEDLGKGDKYAEIEAVEKKEYYTTSSAQRRLYTLQQFDLDSINYNISGAVFLEGNVEIGRLEETFRKLIQRHEALRTTIELVEDEPVQFIHQQVDFKLQYLQLDASSYHENTLDEKAIEETIKNFIKSFDLNKAPLMRVGLVKVASQKHLMIIDMHHIISDGVSMALLIKEFSEIYRGNTLQPLRIQYKDYSEGQKQLSNSSKREKQRKYWLQQLSGEIPVLNLGDYPRPAIQSFEGERLAFQLNQELTKDLRKVCQQTGTTLYMVLLSTFNILLSKYSGQEDIIVGSPIAGRFHADLSNIMGMFVNTLAMRNYPVGNKSFRAFLEEVKKNALEAYENQNYQFEELVEDLNLKRDISRNPIFDVMFTMQNMDRGTLQMEGLTIHPYDIKKTVAKFDITLSALETEDTIDFEIEYATKLFNRGTIEGLFKHLTNILEEITENLEVKLSAIEMVKGEERQLILEGFNSTKSDYPTNKTIQQLIEEQVEKIPEEVAVVYQGASLTYRQLNEKSNQLARVLVDKGVKADTIVGIMVERSLEMMIGIMAILKAGGAYLPIDPEYPQGRISYMLEDSDSNILLTQSWLRGNLSYNGAIVNLDDPQIYQGEAHNLNIGKSQDLAYVIYTSGSTGSPKGVMIEHRSVANLIATLQDRIYSHYGEYLKLALVSPYVFDASVKTIFASLMLGHQLHIVPEDIRRSGEELLAFFNINDIDISDGTPLHLALLSSLENRGLKVQHFVIGGEALSNGTVEELFKAYDNSDISITNVYGPTECCVDSTSYLVTAHNLQEPITIGKPVNNAKIYILDKNMKLQPVGIAGELFVGGVGLARGYLNKPQLTAEKFVENPFEVGEKLYQTGDLAKWLPNGNIEFIGRVDHQVKIRGYRIELGEIENQLMKFDAIEEAVVMARQDATGSQYLCGYIVAKEEIDINHLKHQLSEGLPDYMIPPFILQLEKMPINHNGKIDRKALPQPEEGYSLAVEYEAPRDRVEEILVEIWEEILGLKGIGINENFFELGGHSLRATAMMAKLLKSLKVAVPLKEIFKTPTIKGIAEYIKSAEKSHQSTIEVVEEREYYEASPAQKRLYTLQQLGTKKVGYNMPGAILLEGSVDVEGIEETFVRLIHRHEILRTSFKMMEDEPVQILQREVDFKLPYRVAEEGQLEDILNSFIKPFDLRKAPLLRVELVKVAHGKHVLIFDMHHIVADGTSIGIMIKEFSEIYKGINLEPLGIQYKDYSHWQKKLMTSEKIEDQKKYWLQQFEGEIPVLNLMGDYTRPALQSFEGDFLRYQIDEGLTSQLKKICKETGATMYMLLLSAYTVLLSKYSGQEDIVVGSPIAGRTHGELSNVMGMFVNTLAMRNYPTGEKSFREFLKEVRKNALAAYENQDYQFEELVENLNIRRDMSRNPLFDVMLATQNMEMQEIEIGGLTIKPYPMKHDTAKFDITMFTQELGKVIQINLEYSTKIFKRETIDRFYQHFQRLLNEIANSLDVKISDIHLMTEADEALLKGFNDTTTEYRRNLTLHQLFEEQVEKTPNNIAVVSKDRSMSYKELNERSNQLARVLREKGARPNTTVAIIAERTIDTIVGIVAILKAGAGYLPIDPQYPIDRINYMLQETGLLLIQSQAIEGLSFNGEVINLMEKEIWQAEGSNLVNLNRATDLLYILYTSGSTGIPKGVMLEHRNLVNLMEHQFKNLEIDFRGKVLQYTTMCFDVSFQEIFSTLLQGGSLHLIRDEEQKNPKVLFEFIEAMGIEVVFLPTAFLKFILSQEEYIEKLPSCIKDMITAGEQLVITEEFKKQLQKKEIRLHNHYGPTEAHVVTTYEMEPTSEIPKIPPIGKPISNTRIYIVDKKGNPTPIGIIGELWIAGDCVGRGYLNNPDLTAEKFMIDPFVEGDRVYRTGDLARWLPNGNIEFLGRIDHQVKIRGNRIELGEIENRLLDHPHVTGVVVMVKEEPQGNKYLCSYIATDMRLETNEIKSYLSKHLPEYMIPQYIIQLDHLPLTTNGKVDRRALPDLDEFQLNIGELVAASNETEEILMEIWQRALGVETMGVEDNFFQLGGHSLKAVQIVNSIFKKLNIELQVHELFNHPTIRQLAKFLQTKEISIYKGIERLPHQDYYQLSYPQKRLWMINELDPNNVAYNMRVFIQLQEEVDISLIEKALEILIARHDSLRTRFQLIEGEAVQIIDNQGTFKLATYDLSHLEGKDHLIERNTIEKQMQKPFDLEVSPLIRGTLIKLKEEDYLLSFVMHHIITDGWSMEILSKEFQHLYYALKEKSEISLAPLRIQYKDFAAWQNAILGREDRVKDAREFWHRQLKESIPKLNLISQQDSSESTHQRKGRGYSFSIPQETKNRLKEIAIENHSSLYTILLTGLTILLSKMTNQQDIVIGTAGSGREHDDLKNVMGYFVNTVILRNSIDWDEDFITLLKRINSNTSKALQYQFYPLELVVDELKIDYPKIPIFFNMLNIGDSQNEILEDLEPHHLEEVVDIKFDIVFYIKEFKNTINFRVNYHVEGIDALTIEEMMEEYIGVLKKLSEAPFATLNDLRQKKKKRKLTRN